VAFLVYDKSKIRILQSLAGKIPRWQTRNGLGSENFPGQRPSLYVLPTRKSHSGGFIYNWTKITMSLRLYYSWSILPKTDKEYRYFFPVCQTDMVNIGWCLKLWSIGIGPVVVPIDRQSSGSITAHCTYWFTAHPLHWHGQVGLHLALTSVIPKGKTCIPLLEGIVQTLELAIYALLLCSSCSL
jgi:hypothetical protein